MSSVSFCVFERIFVLPAFLKDISVGIGLLVDRFFSFNTLDVALLTPHLHCF